MVRARVRPGDAAVYHPVYGEVGDRRSLPRFRASGARKRRIAIRQPDVSRRIYLERQQQRELDFLPGDHHRNWQYRFKFPGGSQHRSQPHGHVHDWRLLVHGGATSGVNHGPQFRGVGAAHRGGRKLDHHVHAGQQERRRSAVAAESFRRSRRHAHFATDVSAADRVASAAGGFARPHGGAQRFVSHQERGPADSARSGGFGATLRQRRARRIRDFPSHPGSAGGRGAARNAQRRFLPVGVR